MPSDKRYVKFPTAFIEFIVTAKLPENQNKMLHAAVRNSHGFHKPERTFDLTDLRRWLGWDRRSIYRTAEELVQRGIFVIPWDDKNGRNYRIQNDSQKWNPEWKRASVGNPVDNLLISPSQPSLLGALLSSRGMTSVIPRDDTSATYPQPDGASEVDVKASIENGNPQVETSGVVALHEFLKKSLKKSLKKEDGPDPPKDGSASNLMADPDLKKRKEDYKKKNRIFKEMARTGQWSDAELLELAKKLSVEELEALYYSRRAG